MKVSADDLKGIADELAGIEYGELHIQIRGGQIVSFSIIKSKLNKKHLTNVKQCANAECVRER